MFILGWTAVGEWGSPGPRPLRHEPLLGVAAGWRYTVPAVSGAAGLAAGRGHAGPARTGGVVPRPDPQVSHPPKKDLNNS